MGHMGVQCLGRGHKWEKTDHAAGLAGLEGRAFCAMQMPTMNEIIRVARSREKWSEEAG